MNQKSLFSKSYCFLLGANFLLFFAFYLIMPVLPLYLMDTFQVPNSQIGMIISSYTIAALIVRPFSGYLLDSFARKPLYLFTFILFTLLFGGYVLATTIALFILIRALHGFAFGIVTVGGNTICIDVLPSERRGEGLGYYGLSNNLAMSFGPMTGLLLKSHFSYNILFITAMCIGLLGVLLATAVHTPVKPIKEHQALSLDRFLLITGIPAGLALLLLSIPYGMTSTYLAVFAQESGIENNPGLFFTFMAIGMMSARLFSGRLVDRGWLTQIIAFGMVLVGICYMVLGYLHQITLIWPTTGFIIFLIIALFLGAGFGAMFPAFNTLFVNLGRNDQRGTATSTYLTSWDIGIGVGLLLGGYISEVSSFAVAYRYGSICCFISLILFCLWVTPHFNRHKLR